MFMHFNKFKNKRAQIAVEVAPSTPRHQYITYRSSEIIFNIHLSSVWFFLSCILEKLECQAKFPGYHSNGRIASVSPPSTTYKRQFSSQPKINTNKKKKKRKQVTYLVAKRMQEVILQLRTKVVGKLATAIAKQNDIRMRKENNRMESMWLLLVWPRVDSEGCGQWSSENCDELVPVLRVHYPLLFVVEIESGVLSGEGSPRGIVFVGRRIGIRFGTLPHVISALPEVLSLSSGSASSPPTTHCCRRWLLLILLRRQVMPLGFW